MATGKLIAIDEMTPSHLLNTIKFLERWAQRKFDDSISTGYTMLGFMQGEMAIMDIEQTLNGMEEGGWEALLPKIYYDMKNLAIERELIKC